jgi:hypothetical protein
MKNVFLCLSVAAAVLATAAPARSQDAAAEIIALERKVMDGWVTGNPDPLLAVADPDITYFHVMATTRLDGLDAVKRLVEPFRGTSLFESYEMLEPRVHVAGELGVLTYILVQRNGSAAPRWNGTLVYQRKAGTWRVIHTHWSQTSVPPGGAAAAR